MKLNIYVIFLCLSTILVLSSCYRMPTDDDFSTVPTVNNPAVTNEKPGSFLPGMIGY